MDARPRLSSDRFYIVCHSIIAIGGMKTSHRENMPEHVIRQIQAFKVMIAPFVEWDVDISDRPTERSRAFRRELRHVQRSRPGQLVDFPYVCSRTRQNGRNDLGDVMSSWAVLEDCVVDDAVQCELLSTRN